MKYDTDRMTLDVAYHVAETACENGTPGVHMYCEICGGHTLRPDVEVIMNGQLSVMLDTCAHCATLQVRGWSRAEC